MKDLKNNMDAVACIDPDDYTSSVNGAGVDLRDFEGAVAIAYPGTADFGDANEVYTPKLQESDDNSNWNDVAADDLEGAFAILASDVIQRAGYKGAKRYIRLVLTIAGTTPTIQFCGVIVRGIPHHAPVV
jgi:hypothetical protein